MKKVRKPRKDYTYDDYLQIKKYNKEKLDEILANPNYMEELGKKYYPHNWEVILEDGHFLKKERQKTHIMNAVARAKGEDIPYKKTLFDLPIIQLDENGELLNEFENAKVACEELGWEEKRAQSIIRCCRGEYEKTYGYKWEFNLNNE